MRLTGDVGCPGEMASNLAMALRRWGWKDKDRNKRNRIERASPDWIKGRPRWWWRERWGFSCLILCHRPQINQSGPQQVTMVEIHYIDLKNFFQSHYKVQVACPYASALSKPKDLHLLAPIYETTTPQVFGWAEFILSRCTIPLSLLHCSRIRQPSMASKRNNISKTRIGDLLWLKKEKMDAIRGGWWQWPNWDMHFESTQVVALRPSYSIDPWKKWLYNMGNILCEFYVGSLQYRWWFLCRIMQHVSAMLRQVYSGHQDTSKIPNKPYCRGEIVAMAERECLT